MTNQETIVCAFCQGTGENPHFRGTCPVCKGRGKNQVAGKYTTCPDCHRSGQKGGTTLTCYTCGGLGIIPDTGEEFKRAKEEIKEAQEEIERETGRLSAKRSKPAKQKDDPPRDPCFCQSCASQVEKKSTVKVCLNCFRKIKKIKI